MPDAPTLTREGDELILDLSTTERRSTFQDVLSKVRQIEGKRFDWDTKLWHFPDEPMVADRILRTVRPVADDDLIEWIRSARTREAEEVTTPLPKDGNVMIPWGRERMPWQPETVNGLKFEGLFDFQRAAVAHIARGKRAILADDMGLGKTIQAISTVEEYRLLNGLLDGPKLIIAPKSVKGGWLRELGRWLEPDTYGIQMLDAGTAAKRHEQMVHAITDDLWLIANWEQLRTEHVFIEVKHRNGMTSKEKRIKLKEPLFQVPWAAYTGMSLDDLDPRAVDRLKDAKDKVTAGKWLAVMADEVHRAKNPRAKQTKGLHRIHGELMLGLTGTPVMNQPGELWSLLHWLFPYEYTNYDKFFNSYVDYYEEDYGQRRGIVITGVKNPDALRYEIKGRVIRRIPSEVRDSLPGHRRLPFPVELLPAQKRAYKEAERSMWLTIEKEVDEGKPEAIRFADALMRGDTDSLIRIPNGGVRTTRLLQVIENLAVLGGDDVSATMDEFEDRYDDSRPEPWVVYCAFKQSCTLLAERLRKRHGANVGVYTGEQSSIERTRMEDAFQAGDLDAIVGTIGALKEGITLTRANRGYFLTRDWVPSTNEQCEARYANRTGQQRPSVTYIPQAIGTVATSKVEVTNQLKDKIVRAVHSKETIQEVRA